jgi:hypothetical protein
LQRETFKGQFPIGGLPLESMRQAPCAECHGSLALGRIYPPRLHHTHALTRSVPTHSIPRLEGMRADYQQRVTGSNLLDMVWSPRAKCFKRSLSDLPAVILVRRSSA